MMMMAYTPSVSASTCDGSRRCSSLVRPPPRNALVALLHEPSLATQGTDPCPACRGGGLVPSPGCSCNSDMHTCMPVICTLCCGSGLIRCVRSASETGS